MTAAEVEDDIYTGYNEYSSVYDLTELEQDEVFQEAIKTSYGKRSVASFFVELFIFVSLSLFLYICQHIIVTNVTYIFFYFICYLILLIVLY